MYKRQHRGNVAWKVSKKDSRVNWPMKHVPIRLHVTRVYGNRQENVNQSRSSVQPLQTLKVSTEMYDFVTVLTSAFTLFIFLVTNGHDHEWICKEDGSSCTVLSRKTV